VRIYGANLIQVVKFREGAGGVDLEDRSRSHPVKSAIGSHRESCSERILPVPYTEAVEGFEGARGRDAEHCP